MAAPYSMDLRKKVVEVYKTEKLSQAKLAKRFKISINSVKRYLNRDRETGDLSPKIEGKGRPGKINESGYKVIQKILEERPTVTLEELSKIFYKKKKIKVGRSILSRACQKLHMRRKKLSHYASEQEREDVKKNGKIIGKK
jgi:transposase